MIDQDTPSATPDVHLSVGDRLQQARIAQGLSLEEVAEATRISLSSLRALESMAYDRLPADTFVKGHITLYCDCLGLDAKEMLKRYLQERHDSNKDWPSARQHFTEHALTPKKLAEPSHISSAAIALILLLLIMLSLGGFCLYTSWNPFSFLTGATDRMPSQVLASFHPADPASGDGAHRKALNLDVRFLKETLVHITLDEGPPQQQTFTRDTIVRWEADRHIRLEFLQPDSATLQLNGTSLPFPHGADGHFVFQVPAPSAVR